MPRGEYSILGEGWPGYARGEIPCPMGWTTNEWHEQGPRRRSEHGWGRDSHAMLVQGDAKEEDGAKTHAQKQQEQQVVRRWNSRRQNTRRRSEPKQRWEKGAKAHRPGRKRKACCPPCTGPARRRSKEWWKTCLAYKPCGSRDHNKSTKITSKGWMLSTKNKPTLTIDSENSSSGEENYSLRLVPRDSSPKPNA